MQKLALGFILGISLQMIMGAVSSTETERELSRMRSELEESNRYLQDISRSFDRIDDAFSGSKLTVEVNK